jgi:nitrogen-specific signal transduction histidine kinase
MAMTDLCSDALVGTNTLCFCIALAIARAIARAQGGFIECESTLGVGSTVTMILPVSYSAEILETEPEQKFFSRLRYNPGSLN